MARPNAVPLTRKAKVLIGSAVSGDDNKSNEEKEKVEEDDDGGLDRDEDDDTVALKKLIRPHVSTAAKRINKRIGNAIANKSKSASNLKPSTYNGVASNPHPASNQWDDAIDVDDDCDGEDTSSTTSFKTVPEAVAVESLDFDAAVTDSVHGDDEQAKEDDPRAVYWLRKEARYGVAWPADLEIY